MIEITIGALATAIAVLGVALLVDVSLGEPPLQVHPTAWMGWLTARCCRVALRCDPRTQRAYGAFLSLAIILIFACGAYLLIEAAARVFGEPIQIAIAAVLLKSTFSIRLMHRYAAQLASAVRRSDYTQARAILRHIVRRDPEQLNDCQVISAGVETIAESTADGITSPLFYFALFGIPGAFAYRAINTLDSMVGYKTPEFVNIGWFSARLDSIANWLPARLTALLTVLSAVFLSGSASDSWRILLRDRNRTESWNAGWLMSAMAGALKVKLEKPSSYTLGDPNQSLTEEHLTRAARAMLLNTVFFLFLVVIPVMMTVRMAGLQIG
jgi:adenosylcobinamide-phosphate synthase